MAHGWAAVPELVQQKPGTQQAWLARALSQPGTARAIDAPGGHQHCLTWNADAIALPGLLFVHGYRCHAHYWDAIAPAFAASHRVVAMDLPGMGDSAHRQRYDAQGFSDAIATVITATGLGPAIVVGHSYGGSRALRAAAEHPTLVRHVIAVDSICRVHDEKQTAAAPRRRTDSYPDYASACRHFRLTPEQPCDHPALLDHVARHSIGPVPGGWLWKFDPALPAGPHEGDMTTLLGRLQIPVDYLRGEFSPLISREFASEIVARLPRGRGPVELAGSYHYPMLDQPLGLVTALRALLA
jgi:pimeloyl-ACP methyl ester carboxylesterase